ncbi:hypothetical protein SAMN05421810_105161 [Amycolatopsis arida]|uniref:Glycosyltransferase 2-like domain-containing protein n=1 Tax=Amycolatopsis arida TaxID=587909 RepID=A0A1I5WLC6_9PSEU|nr:hypothetical protein CLV69_105180 [Amycolatopsis arida]SFQ20358.1 hypothetical protein SAMN05421810_105161 [Amycolatopsis arida]
MPGAVSTTVVVVTWRGADHVTACLDALAAQDRPHATLVVDNASRDGTAALLAAHPSAPTVLRLDRNVGYAGALAAALARVDTPYLAWLNDDAAPAPGWLAALENALRPGVAAVASRLEHPDGTMQSAGVRLTRDGHGADITAEALPTAEAASNTAEALPPAEAASNTAEALPTAEAATNTAEALPPAEAATNTTQAFPLPEAASGTAGNPEPFGFCGGAALLRTDVLRAVGGVPAAFFCYYEDTDTAWRLRLAGHRVVLAPAARVRHLHGASTRPGSTGFHRWNERNRLLMLLRCAPAEVALRELARFAAITAALPLRRTLPRTPRRAVPDAANFRVGLRCRVLVEVLGRLPASLRQRRAIGRRATAGRRAVWRTWAGR